MNIVDLIIKKRNGKELSTDEISFFVDAYSTGAIPDYQASALLMAIYFQDMTIRETIDLTRAMVKSGDTIDLSFIEGVKVDKHSTGGVGDTTSLVLAPMIAALGIPVGKMSGRGLGHTGGTIDKLESFNGFSVDITSEQFINTVNEHKLAIMAQTGNITPADKKLYALRDVTGTVENISLIASSVMCKKIAAGADCILLDVKVGSGAFMKNYEQAKHLAEVMVKIGNSVGKKTIAILSDMDQPLGYAIGNILEVKEAIETLKGNGPTDLTNLCITIGSHMVVLAGKAKTLEEANKMLKGVIKDGLALNKFKELISAQGGNTAPFEDLTLFPVANHIIEVKSNKTGSVTAINAEKIGLTSMMVGAGRSKKDDIIDLTAGIILNKKRGDKVNEGEILAYIHTNKENAIPEVVKSILDSYLIDSECDNHIPLIYDVIK